MLTTISGKRDEDIRRLRKRDAQVTGHYACGVPDDDCTVELDGRHIRRIEAIVAKWRRMHDGSECKREFKKDGQTGAHGLDGLR